MGTLVNGIKEIFATAKTTGSNVMLCGNDGTPDGHMTMANLASVLGVPKKIQFVSDSLSTYIESGMYGINDSKYLPNDYPDTGGNWKYGLLVVQETAVENSYPRTQFLYDYDSGYIYYRNLWANLNWDSWKKLTFDIPSFYKNYSDLASLSIAIGAQLGFSKSRTPEVNTGATYTFTKVQGGLFLLYNTGSLMGSMLAYVSYNSNHVEYISRTEDFNYVSLSKVGSWDNIVLTNNTTRTASAAFDVIRIGAE